MENQVNPEEMKIKKVVAKKVKSKLEKCFDELTRVNQSYDYEWIVKINKSENDIRVTGMTGTIHMAYHIFNIAEKHQFLSYISSKEKATVIIY